MPTLGLEEEVFITEPERPSLRSLYYLARLLAKDPKYYYVHSASNFARFRDIRYGLMSGVEISTGVHSDADGLIEDLSQRRRDLSSVATGLVVAAGHLLEQDTPSNVCGLQIHIGPRNKERTYRNIVHFLPLLMLLTANSPGVNGRRFGKSYRIANSFAIGPLTPNRTRRFQDIIYSRRLGTIEVRVCDPTWDVARIHTLVRALVAIEALDTDLPFNPLTYNELRGVSASTGYTERHQELYGELTEICDADEALFLTSPSDQLWEVYERHGATAAYSAADGSYREGAFAPHPVKRRRLMGEIAAAAAGVAGYFVPKLPYYTWKAIIES